ncbi:hypothetical protein FSP39_002049 [Pinctada imbricata]|uniref:G-protein coupled receptors family 1 profile domain-containing protein n=1 Tax=Pinctada imbricata TaxID=66713 RepID=A0AA88YDB8_PINIB|nr:hypothetical protein FSP39_002049 [Pinctada imbricata]
MEFSTTTSLTSSVVESNTSFFNNRTERYTGIESYNVPAFVYTVVLTVIGVVGNSHALFINVQRFRYQIKQQRGIRNPYIVFVLSLSILDMFACAVVLPMENADLSSPFTPFSDPMCKFFRYLQFVIHISSVFHIVLISIHCWRQVCYPRKRQLNGKLAIKCCLAFDVLALSVSVMLRFLSGHKTKIIDGETGDICIIGERNAEPTFLRAAMGILSFGFVGSLFIICLSYIALLINKWTGKNANIDNSEGNTDRKRDLQKTTATLIILTVIFVVAYVPFMILAAIKAVDREFQNNLQGASAAAHGIFLRFPLINNVVNPFVYGLKDPGFREKLLQIYPCLRRKETKSKDEASPLN